MEAITVKEYHSLRDEIFKDLVACGVADDSDENFNVFDGVLGNKLTVIW